MIRQHKIPDDSGKGSYTIFESLDFEYKDPTKHYADAFILTNISLMREIMLLKKLPFPQDIIEKCIFKEAIKDWCEKLKEIEETQIPGNLLSLLKADNKKEQVKILKNLSITTDQLLAFIFKAWTDYGFTFSQYRSEHQHSGLDETAMPKIVEIKDGKVNKVGNTSLTDGQLKNAVDHRKVIVAKFIDKETSWHCFFLTYESLKGKESWKNGQPHYHYISNKFGIPRQEVVKQLKSRKYNLGNLPHIDFDRLER